MKFIEWQQSCRVFPKDHVGFEASRIRIGSSIAAFFINQEIGRVVLEYNYLDKTLIIEGMSDAKASSYKYPIKGGGCTISTVNRKMKDKFKVQFFIESFAHVDLLDFTRRYLIFKAEPFSKDQIIIKDLPLLDFFALETIKVVKGIVDMKNSKVILFASVYKHGFIPSRTEELIEKIRQRRLQKEKTFQNNQVENKIGEQKFPGRVRDNTNKEMDPFSELKNSEENSLSQKELERIDKEYSKMILGE